MSETNSALAGLNNEQKLAAQTIEGPLLILAGAGAGKTKTLTHRMYNIILHGTAPEAVLAITFTNKAAKEMRERVMKLLRESKELNRPIGLQEKPFVSTFHALCVHILRENHELLGIPRSFSILDRDDQKKAIREALKRADFDPKQHDLHKIINMISRAKNDFLTLEEYETEQYENPNKSFNASSLSRIWREYQQIVKSQHAMDFDDLLLQTGLLLRDNLDVRKKYQTQWQYVHIDEYQDTNQVQYEIARLLTGEAMNICAVGDMDQNIYSWRGAKMRNILHFEKDFPNAEIILLEQNYRSTKRILEAANSIIAKNVFRKEKNLFTKNEEGEKIELYEASSETDESQYIAEKTASLVASGVLPEHIAVLYRTNFQSRALEEAFLGLNIPYHLVGTRFFERAEVKNILCYLKAALNPDSRSDIARIINVPTRGIGKTTVAKLFAGDRDKLPARTAEKVNAFYRLLEDVRIHAENHRASETIRFIMEKTGLAKTPSPDNEEGGDDNTQETTVFDPADEEEAERLNNMQELVSLAARYDEMEPSLALDALLTDSALATDQDSIEEKREGVRLMTIHAAKGLEFQHVFVTGLEEGLFPQERMNEQAEDSEEERRLFYVALTRAEKKLYLTHARMRTIFGEMRVNTPSQFLQDIQDDLLERVNPPSGEPMIKIEF